MILKRNAIFNESVTVVVGCTHINYIIPFKAKPHYALIDIKQQCAAP